MKISELTPITSARRDIIFPLCVAGENMSITLGQIIDALNVSAPQFGGVNEGISPTVVAGNDTITVGQVIYDSDRGKFYRAVSDTTTSSGVESTVWTYYENWATYGNYYDTDGNIRTDVVFVNIGDGLLYAYNGTGLIRIGFTEEQANQLALSTPIKIADEDAMEALISSGKVVEGQLYYIEEES